MSTSLPHLLSLRDLPAATWRALVESAERLAGPAGRAPLLAGHRFGMVFFNASLRTRTAFEVAAFDLGAHAVNLQVGGGLWSLEHRDGVRMDGPHAEHVKEGFGVLARMVDAIGLRAFAGLVDAAADAADPILHAAARASTVPILNLESALDHPHQGLADALTVRRKIGERAKVVLTWAPHIKPLPLAVPHAALLAFAHEGHDVVVAHPEGFDLNAGILADATRLAAAAGGSVQVTNDRSAALAGARVVYAKSWGSPARYGRDDAAEAVQAHPDWIVDGAAMARTDGAVFMHCLPVRRGVVVADEVLDSAASVVLDQGAARLDVQKATLCRALGVQA
ncbi:MAG: N-acetylornithine carbamoyltransferase [Planctomycetota bacterium]|nr:N-acetylornithine carbamoyltransferase [Planctomycetota bacterium]